MSVVAAYHVYVCVCVCVCVRARCFQCREVYIPPCTTNTIHTNIWYAATTLIIMEYS